MKPLVAFNAEMNDVAQLEADAKAWVAKKVNLTGVPMEIREAAEEGDELIERFLALIGERFGANRVVPDTLDHEVLARFVGQLRLASGREITDAVASYLHSLNSIVSGAVVWKSFKESHDFDFQVTRPDENEGFGKCICGWDTGDLEMTETDAEVKFDQHLDDERRELGEI